VVSQVNAEQVDNIRINRGTKNANVVLEEERRVWRQRMM
jgi:hypothetical protein